jgi:hypothetical protein
VSFLPHLLAALSLGGRWGAAARSLAGDAAAIRSAGASRRAGHCDLAAAFARSTARALCETAAALRPTSNAGTAGASTRTMGRCRWPAARQCQATRRGLRRQGPSALAEAPSFLAVPSSLAPRELRSQSLETRPPTVRGWERGPRDRRRRVQRRVAGGANSGLVRAPPVALQPWLLGPAHHRHPTPPDCHPPPPPARADTSGRRAGPLPDGRRGAGLRNHCHQQHGLQRWRWGHPRRRRRHPARRAGGGGPRLSERAAAGACQIPCCAGKKRHERQRHGGV